MGLKLLRYDSDAMPVINMIIFQFFITAFLCVYYNVFCVLIVVAPKKINHIE
jgi:hypothetical protein